MNRPVELKTRPQLALESYLDALLQDATAEELPEPILVLEPVVVEPESTLDEFQLAVLEEQARDAHVVVPIVPAPVVVTPVVVEPVVDVHLPPSITPPPVTGDGRPSWAAEPFECLLFDVAGLTLAVPLVCLGSIYSLEGQELTPLFGQPEWFLGILPSQAGNLKVLDTARWVMPDRYRDDFRQGLQYVISVQGYEWGLAVHQVSRSLRLDPNEIKWRSHRGQRPWLAGTVIEHMCALLDVAELAELIASGAVKTMPQNKRS
ncbi:CheW domain-containing protein [Pseudomonas edaphica]|uniref:CheW domain-containing protein n=1 Tax=Pseudomonas edaphica TaxID=2006980 RepID=A0A7Y8E636_9PSED|nr:MULTISPECIES: CheW domain-containing protein [Pseudomonas]NVZ58640.1 CheW domain-containing protein [Pseudomonas edaphica]NWC45201.1 CheW domain-containing protein [Pseudomonas sp. IPO3747]NWE08743.1 CheW domain-containing protein [Pseudomonas edaphica]NWE81227.1 CheW domain-containing protein [Pseudomonas edaphica]